MLDRGDGSTREVAIVVDGTVPVEVPWVRRVMGDWPASGFWWDSSKDEDRKLLERMHRLFPEAQISNWNTGDVAVAADKRWRQQGSWGAPHPGYLEQGR